MDYCKRFRVKPKSPCRLDDYDPADTAGVKGKNEATERLGKIIPRLSELQYLLYAESRRSVLIVLQAMDAGGKDGTIRHVMGPLNPQGCRVTSFKAPSGEELRHDYLWRVHQHVPARGEIGIFNRSHYEDVLIVRVHDLVPKSVWRRRYRQINQFERHLAENDVHILKFFLHISPGQQRRRFQARLDDPTRHWKINPQDFEESKRWKDYLKAYEQALQRCSSAYAPWYVIPSDHKWFRNLAVSQILLETLEGLKMKFPEPQFDISQIQI